MQQPHQPPVTGVPLTQQQLIQQHQQMMQAAQVQPPALLQPAPALASLPPAPGLNVAVPQLPPPGAAAPMSLAHQIQMQSQMQFHQLLVANKITPAQLANPQWQAFVAMQQRAVAAQAQAQYTKQAAAAAAAAAAAQVPALGLPKASGKPTGEQGKKAAAAAAGLAMPPPPPAQKKRKLAEFKLPDKPYHILPESPLFVALQDAERRLDAAAHRKRAEVQEAYSSFKKGQPGEEQACGAIRKRLRVYLFTHLYNQPQRSATSPQAEPAPGRAPAVHPTQDPPSWCFSIHGRLVDPDSTHPGGGGDGVSNTHVPRHHFSHYVRRVVVRPNPVQRPAGSGVVVWDRSCHDREPRDCFHLHHLGSAPGEVDVTLELEHTPQLYHPTPALEALLNLPAGPVGGLYSLPYLVSHLWAYAKANGLWDPDEPHCFTLDEATAAALKVQSAQRPGPSGGPGAGEKPGSPAEPPPAAAAGAAVGAGEGGASETAAADGQPQQGKGAAAGAATPAGAPEAAAPAAGDAGTVQAPVQPASAAAATTAAPAAAAAAAPAAAPAAAAAGPSASSERILTVVSFEQVQALLKAVLEPAKAVTVRHVISVQGGSPLSEADVVDLHFELPVSQETPVFLQEAKAQLDSTIGQLDSSLAAVMQQYQEHKRRRTILAAFSDNPSGTVQAIINAQAKELRISSGKEGDLAEVMSPGEVFKERWVEDAVLKYLSKKQAAGMAQRQMAQVVAMQTAAMAQTMAMQTAMQQAAAAAAAQGAGPSTNVAAAGAPVIVATPPAQVLQPAAVPPQPAAP